MTADKTNPTKKQAVPVTVNRASQIQIPTARHKDGSLDPNGILFLQPGANLIDAERWTEAKKIATVRTLLTEKIAPSPAPEARQEKVGCCTLVEGTPVDAEDPLMSMGEVGALAFVHETFDTRLLKQLTKQTKDEEMLRIVQAQLDKIEQPKAEQRAKLHS